MDHLGVMLAGGRGVPKDLTKAFDWYTKGANAGHPKCMWSVGWAYENGWVRKDLSRAVEWYRKAAKLGVQEAQDALKRLGKE